MQYPFIEELIKPISTKFNSHLVEGIESILFDEWSQQILDKFWKGKIKPNKVTAAS